MSKMQFIPLDAIGRRPRKRSAKRPAPRAQMPRDLRLRMAEWMIERMKEITRNA